MEDGGMKEWRNGGMEDESSSCKQDEAERK